MANLVTASEVVTAINEACSEQDIDGICIRRLKSSALDLSSVERKNVCNLLDIVSDLLEL